MPLCDKCKTYRHYVSENIDGSFNMLMLPDDYRPSGSTHFSRPFTDPVDVCWHCGDRIVELVIRDNSTSYQIKMVYM